MRETAEGMARADAETQKEIGPADRERGKTRNLCQAPGDGWAGEAKQGARAREVGRAGLGWAVAERQMAERAQVQRERDTETRRERYMGEAKPQRGSGEDILTVRKGWRAGQWPQRTRLGLSAHKKRSSRGALPKPATYKANQTLTVK